jgi:hypothetical protein
MNPKTHFKPFPYYLWSILRRIGAYVQRNLLYWGHAGFEMTREGSQDKYVHLVLSTRSAAPCFFNSHQRNPTQVKLL